MAGNGVASGFQVGMTGTMWQTAVIPRNAASLARARRFLPGIASCKYAWACQNHGTSQPPHKLSPFKSNVQSTLIPGAYFGPGIWPGPRHRVLSIFASAYHDANSTPVSENEAKTAEEASIPRQVASTRSFIREIRIRDYALVSEQSVRFVPGLNIVTGESGSGKSVLLSALGQLLGAPVDPDCIRPPATRTLIEGELHVAASHWPAVERLLEPYPAATAMVSDFGSCADAAPPPSSSPPSSSFSLSSPTSSSLPSPSSLSSTPSFPPSSTSTSSPSSSSSLSPVEREGDGGQAAAPSPDAILTTNGYYTFDAGPPVGADAGAGALRPQAAATGRDAGSNPAQARDGGRNNAAMVAAATREVAGFGAVLLLSREISTLNTDETVGAANSGTTNAGFSPVGVAGGSRGYPSGRGAPGRVGDRDGAGGAGIRADAPGSVRGAGIGGGGGAAAAVAAGASMDRKDRPSSSWDATREGKNGAAPGGGVGGPGSNGALGASGVGRVSGGGAGRAAGSAKGSGTSGASNVRSVCRINGVVVPLKVLRAVGQLLVDVNGQNVQQSLVKENAQVALLDRFAGTSPLAAQFGEMVDRADALAQELHALDERMAMDEDELERMVEEINAVNPRVGEDAALRRALQSLELRRATVEACQRVHATLTTGAAGDGGLEGGGVARRGVYTALRSVLHDLSSIDVEALERAAGGGAGPEGDGGQAGAEQPGAGAADLDLDFGIGDPECLVEAVDLVEQAQALLRRAEALVEDFAADTPVSDLEREPIVKRSREIERLKHRYRAPSIQALRRAAEEAEQTLAEFASMSQRCEQLEAELQDVGRQLAVLGAALSSKRREAAGDMCRSVEASLEHLHMASSRFHVQLSWTPTTVAPQPGASPIDQGKAGGALGGRFPEGNAPRTQGRGNEAASRGNARAYREGGDVQWQEVEDEGESQLEVSEEADDYVDEAEDGEGLEDGEGEEWERGGRAESRWGKVNGVGHASEEDEDEAEEGAGARLQEEVDVWGPVENSLLVPGCDRMGEHEQVYYKFGRQGFDKVTFLLAASHSEPLRPLTSVASGGECARIMLALKTMPGASASDGGLSIAIFDELDSGVGGRIGGRVGVSLHRLCSAGHQVICVTHLPQVAVFANHHVKVSKSMAPDGRMLTELQELGGEGERLEEVAHMLGLGPSAASELLRNARREAQEVAAELRRAEAAKAAETEGVPRFDWTQGVIVKSGTFLSASSAEKGMAAAGGGAGAGSQREEGQDRRV